jgi:hypothetical protein
MKSRNNIQQNNFDNVILRQSFISVLRYTVVNHAKLQAFYYKFICTTLIKKLKRVVRNIII